MNWKIRCLFTVMIFAGISARALANCEAGAYLIHTVAEYKPQGVGTPILKYSIEKDKFRLRIPTHPGGKLMTRAVLKKLVDVKFGTETCKLGKIVFSKDDMDLYLAHYPIGSCKDLGAKIPAKGFIAADLKQGRLNIAQQLEVKTGGAGLSAHEALMMDEVKAGKIIPSRGLDGKATDGSRKLALTDISQSRFEYTSVGKFQMAVMILTIPKPQQFFPQIEGFGVELKGRAIEFPVIFFIDEGKPPRFVADGSNCADVKIAYARSEKTLAPDRFKLTSAFDLNGDQSPDVIEVNDTFDYELSSDGKLWVIDYQQGC